MLNPEDLEVLFTYHPPDEDDARAYQRLRATGHLLAQVILQETPPSADQTAAIRKVREAVFTANAARACASGPEKRALHRVPAATTGELHEKLEPGAIVRTEQPS